MPPLSGWADTPSPKLIGRDNELKTLLGKIEAVGNGGKAIVVRGGAGIGKSALLRAVAHQAAAHGFSVLTSTAVQSEVDLPFASLHQLLVPVLGAVDTLPATSRHALDTAFGLGDATAPSVFLIGLATLQLLGERSEIKPLVLLVDDAQWLDPSSADVMAFVARRLESDAIALMFAIREGFESVILGAGLPELMLESLNENAAAELLDTASPGLSPLIRDRILHDAAGNPLALVELPKAVWSAGIDDAFPSPWLPLTARLTRVFGERFASLSGDARRFLLVVAADEKGVLAEVLAAAERLAAQPLMPEVISEAEAAGLIEVALDKSVIRFRHPLMRSAIYDAAKLVERQAVHAALADVVLHDPDRRAWHLAAGTVGVDDEVAETLEAAATRASRRGAYAAAFQIMERAARVSRDASARATRLLTAAELAYYLGRHRESLRLLREVHDQDLSPADQPRLAHLRQVADDEGTWSGAAAVAKLVESADRLWRAGAIADAMGILVRTALTYWWSNPDLATRTLVVDAAERIPVPEDDPDLLTVLALAAPVERGAVAAEGLRRVAAQPLSAVPNHNLGIAATGVGDFAVAERFLEASTGTLRAEGSLGLLANTLVSRAWTGILRGNWRVAACSADESARIAEETGQLLWAAVARLAAATLAAYQGGLDRAEALTASAEKVFVDVNARPMLALVQIARGAACLADDRFDAAYEQLRRIYIATDVAYHPHVRAWSLVDLVEAAIHCGREGDASEFVKEQEVVFAQARWPLLKVHLDAARAFLSADDDAEARFRTALDDNPDASPFVRARLQLAYGAWLKRRRRVADSRHLLRAAWETFNALGASPWAERARRELRASGETSRRSAPSLGWLALSPQELQIAELAAEGSSNKEIARQLFLSHRTVGSHLYRIFPKLGITTRSQLAGALRNRSQAAVE